MSQLLEIVACPVCGADVPLHIEPCDFHINLPASEYHGPLTQYCPACAAELCYDVRFTQTIDYWLEDLVEVNDQPAAGMAVAG